jgi:hypothetical protein
MSQEYENIIVLEEPQKPSKPVHTFTLKQCPVTNVKVYNDRAEVKREVKVKLVEGEQKILIKEFPYTTINDSARVSGESASEVTILEVSYQNGTEDIKNDQAKRKELENQVDQLLDKQRDLNAKLSRARVR